MGRYVFKRNEYYFEMHSNVVQNFQVLRISKPIILRNENA